MKIINKGLRLLVMVLLLLAASFGVGFTGVLQNSRERYMDIEIKTEQVDKKEEDEDEDEEKK